MQRTNIYLEPEQCAALDRIAAEEGTSRAEVIRRLLARALEGGDHDLDVDLDAIRSSFGALTDVEPDERGPDERQRHLDRMWKLGA
ncbi:MAG: CopG family transcriptional regulator [Actinomycetota bacterium]|nr:CopG family transcriptional regulator [Actinomycetota bacterium]